MEGKNRLDRNPLGFSIMAYTIVGIMAILGLAPFWLLVSGSLTDNATIMREGFTFWPSMFSLDAYRMVFAVPEVIFRAYFVTIFITIAGTLGTVLLCSITGYSLSRKDFAYRNAFAFFFYFPSLFSGGLIPFFLLMIALGMRNNPLSMILPAMMSFFFIVVLRSFFKQLPDEIGESGKMDGANELVICFKLYMPMAVPAIATIALFAALNYWNSWQPAMLFINDPNWFPLQLVMHRILNAAGDVMRYGQMAGVSTRSIPTQAFQLAMVCVATGPIILLFPFIQKYFIKGLTIGAVKG
ncbi:MAG: carbohydrate ABC transporter permease [Defluviitaleaceae bacterium]|nr:carbohydrate ABC transporter permease [Defluviitaleaceae bacterium]